MSKRICLLLLILMLEGCQSGNVASQVTEMLRCIPFESSKSGIVGGSIVESADPDQSLVVMINASKDRSEHICTGVAISERVILTAAHCIQDFSLNQIKVFAPTNKNCPINSLRQDAYLPDKIIIHKEFNGTPQGFADLALIRLESSLSPEHQILKISSASNPDLKDELLLLGYGVTAETARDSQTLRRTFKSIKSDLQVREKYIFVNQADTQGGFCRGDSGAPLIGNLWREPVIIGINSANIGKQTNQECHTSSLSMNLDYYSDWLRENQQNLQTLNWISDLIHGPIQRR